jgi:hypothetical protein
VWCTHGKEEVGVGGGAGGGGGGKRMVSWEVESKKKKKKKTERGGGREREKKWKRKEEGGEKGKPGRLLLPETSQGERKEALTEKRGELSLGKWGISHKERKNSTCHK